MIKEPLLSICIPTYNRGKYLKRLLDSIVCQEEFVNTDEVEIIVDDGPSEDDTEQMVKKYIRKYGNKIKYYRNPIRIGMCPAFLEALQLGSGKYLWLMGSDDSLYNNALKQTLKTIKGKNDLKLILSGRINANEKERNIKSEKYRFNGFIELSNFFGNIKNDFSFIDVCFTFISVFCVNKNYFFESYNKLISKGFKKDFLNKHYFNFSLISYSNLENGDIAVIKEPRLIEFVQGNTSWHMNKKIIKDLVQLYLFLMKEYKVSFKCKIFFMKSILLWISPVILIKKILYKLHLKKIYDYFANIYNKRVGNCR